MKRLIRKAFGTILYHGTTLDKLKNITDMGMIMPQEESGGGIDTMNQNEAKQRTFNILYNEGLKPDAPEWNERFQTVYEEEFAKEESKFEGFTFFADRIDVAELYSKDATTVIIEVSAPEESLLPDDNDCPDCEDWKESLKRTNQVKVLGPITSDYISGVYIYPQNRNELIQFYPKLTWVDNYKPDTEPPLE